MRHEDFVFERNLREGIESKRLQERVEFLLRRVGEIGGGRLKVMCVQQALHTRSVYVQIDSPLRGLAEFRLSDHGARKFRSREHKNSKWFRDMVNPDDGAIVAAVKSLCARDWYE